MARTAGLLVTATLLVCLLPLFPSSNLPPSSSQVAATNSTLPQPRVWIDVSTGILPVYESSESAGTRGTGAEPREPAAPDRAVPRGEAELVGVVRAGLPPGAGEAGRRSGIAGTWEAAREFLRRRGIDRFRLESIGQPLRYRFTCWVPLDGNPYVTRQFVGEGTDELAAVWDAIAEIKAWEKQ